MAKFKITTEDGTFQVEAETPDDALAALEQTSKNNYMGPTDKNGVPEGMVFDPATNRMVDAKALADKTIPGGSWVGDALKGMPFAGEYADELAGYLTSSSDTKNHPNESQPIQTEVARQSQQTFEKENPKTALASKLAVGATTLPLAIEGAAALPAASSLLGRTLVGATAGGLTGATEGAVSGFGEGTGDNRIKNAGDRAMWGGALGAAIGGAAPVVADAVSAGARNLLDRFTVDRQLQQIGVTRPAADAVKSAMQADDALGPVGRQRINAAGPDAMLADAGPSASSLLDTTIQRSGKAGRLANAAVEKRAADADTKLKGTMDLVLGKPPGIDAAAQKIYKDSAAARDAAYNVAHSKPIDYSSKAGRAIEDVFIRTPDSILGPAIRRANDMMQIRGIRNKQILASIADDGTVTLRQMPNTIQADYLKRALNDIAEKSKDNRGILSPEGVDASMLAKQLRQALVKAVPEYATASKLGGDTIEEKNALETGFALLRPSTTREDIRNAVDGISPAEQKQMLIGLRQYIDDTTANVTKALKDKNMDAREAAKALKDMSSRAAREKLEMALGPQKAKILFTQLEQAEAAISLKADVVANSRTFARQEVNRSVEDRGKDGVLNAVKRGEPLQVGKRSWQRLTGADANSEQARGDAIYEDIAALMTGARGPDAQAALQRLEQAYKAGTLNQETARKLGRYLSGGALLPSYQLSTQ